jgi:ADP-heptose:LPS heptosyltransferase
MHIAAALMKPIVSLWGNTIPEFGMYPYLPKEKFKIVEHDVPCRPCSKIGYMSCPKGHFNCMNLISPERVLTEMEDLVLKKELF